MVTTPFDAKKDTTLDDSEKYIRDRLDVNLNGWARFRREINCGTDISHLTWLGPESDEKKDAYLDLGKSLYEIVCCLGYAKWNFEDISTSRVTLLANKEPNPADYLPFLKLTKEFYYSAGCIMDNLARIVLILNHAKSDSELKRFRDGNTIPIRRHVSWGDIKLKRYGHFNAYDRWCGDADLEALLLIRHFLTHCWSPLKKVSEDGTVLWPEETRSEKVFVWPHDIHESGKASRLNFVPVIPMMKKDFETIERVQNEMFDQLTADVPGFESRYGFVTSKIKDQFSA